MEKVTFKKLAALTMAIVLSASVFSGCSGSSTGSGSSAAATSSAAQTTAKQKVNFWYLWGGDEAKVLEKVIAAYNKSQDKYEVVGLSTPDQQKVLTSISGGQGPDITDDFGGSIPNYAAQNIAMPLDDLIAADKFDTSVYVDAAMNQQKYQGKTYALPISVNVFALYYNKDLLSKAGITTLPKTLEELMEMSNKTTKVSGGKITQLGDPFITDSYWFYCYTYANGDNFGTAADKLTPNNAGFKKALDYAASEVKAFGKAPLNNYITSGNSKKYTPQDPFCAGTQAFRVDGSWMYKIAKDAKVTFDIMPLPGTASKGGDGYSMLDTSMVYIPSTTKCKEGAFDFAKYISSGEGAKIFITEKGDLPSTKALAKDESIINLQPLYKTYLDIIAKNNLIALPQMTDGTAYDKNIRTAVQSVLLGGTVDSALAQLEKSSANLK